MATYSEKLVDEICERIADGEPLRQICRDEHMPNWTSVYDWVNKYPEFALRIAHARELGFDAIAEETLSIADDGTNDWMEKQTQSGSITVLDAEHVQRSKLRIETRLKLLAKWSPKKYGEKIQQEISNPDGSLTLNDAEKLDKLSAIMAKAKARQTDSGTDLV